MKISPEDPRLTAYALDELDGAKRMDIETELENSDEYRREVEEVTRAAALLSAELEAEPVPELTYARRLAIESKLKTNSDKTAARTHFAFGVLFRGRSPVGRAPVFAAGAALLIGICLALCSFFTGAPGGAAMAQTWEQIQKARFITWTETIYVHEASQDGQSGVHTFTRKYTYKVPGIYRTEQINHEGLTSITIEDAANRRQLHLVPAQRKATLREITIPTMGESEGPCASVMKLLQGNSLQLVETRSTPTGDVNIFRYAIKAKDNANGTPWSYDFWIDSRTKRLVELHIPGIDIYDPDTDPARNNPPGTIPGWINGRIAGSVRSGFVFDADLDDALFRLDPPAGYAVETKGRLYVTEKEMIEFLGILAEYNDQVYPESQELGGVFSDGRQRDTFVKSKEDRTTTEQKFVEIIDHYGRAGLEVPTGQFIYDSTVENSFRYLGEGVKLGDKDRVVCWYKLKGATIYRVVYGDLSVRDVPPEDLPLPVEP
jgi:hypothetical protein